MNTEKANMTRSYAAVSAPSGSMVEILSESC
jgi:hypothetical protein